MKTLPQPWRTIFTGWIYDHLLPHAEQVKVAHPLMLRAIAAAKKKNDRIDGGKMADCLRRDFLNGCIRNPSLSPDGQWLVFTVCWPSVDPDVDCRVYGPMVQAFTRL